MTIAIAGMAPQVCKIAIDAWTAHGDNLRIDLFVFVVRLWALCNFATENQAGHRGAGKGLQLGWPR